MKKMKGANKSEAKEQEGDEARALGESQMTGCPGSWNLILRSMVWILF